MNNLKIILSVVLTLNSVALINSGYLTLPGKGELRERFEKAGILSFANKAALPEYFSYRTIGFEEFYSSVKKRVSVIEKNTVEREKYEKAIFLAIFGNSRKVSEMLTKQSLSEVLLSRDIFSQALLAKAAESENSKKCKVCGGCPRSKL